MGGALLGHWARGNDSFTIVDPFLETAPECIRLVAEREQLDGEIFDTIIVAIKPQQIDEVLPLYAGSIADDGYVMSIAAGASIRRLKQAAGNRPVIRVMPNLPAAIGQCVAGLCASDDATPDQIAHADAMMQRAGTSITVDSEDMLDRVTAVAGSGPGYVFEIARAYVAAAMKLGFDEDQARDMVLGTMAGTVAMARNSEQPLEELRNSVTSKNGTTYAGLQALNEVGDGDGNGGDDGGGDLSRLLNDTLGAAYNRAVELR